MVFRLFAFAVAAQKGVETRTAAPGGPLTQLQQLGDVVLESSKNVRGNRWISVRLNVDSTPGSRRSPVRDAVLGLAFGTDAESADAADVLADRLSAAMDQRSTGCLLAIAVVRNGTDHEVTVWTFPRDESLRFSTGGPQGPTVEVLQDAFSRTSHLRKAAVFAGRDQGPTSFLTAKVVDLQSGGRDEAADYWVHEFLDAELTLSADIGSAALARAIRSAWDSAADDGEREQLSDATIAVRASRRQRWSLASFAEEYLDGTTKARFMRTREFRDHRSEQFAFRTEAFDRILNFRVLRLENGVRISAPLAKAEELLDFTETPAGMQVTARGVVSEDKVSQRG